MNKGVTEPLLRLTSSTPKTNTHYGELLSDRVQNIRETLGIAPTIFIEIIILFFMEKVLVLVAGRILKATVTW